MTSDSTELTFVRCPSCRSLVPAVSTRCRMCGASLDTSVKSEEGTEEDKKSGRVRQRTMSDKKGDFASTVSKLRQESGAADKDEALQAKGPAQESEEDSIDDPLSAYLEEVDDVTEAPAPAPKKPEPAFSPAASAQMKQAERTPAPVPQPEKKPVAPSPAVNGEAARDDSAETPQKQKVIVESGGWRGNKPSGLSFGRAKDEETRRAEPVKEAQPATQPSAQVPAPQKGEDRREESRQARSESAAPPPARTQEVRQQQPPHPQHRPAEHHQHRERERDERNDQRHDRRQQQQTERSREAAHGARREEKNVEGRLVGWLVSYAVQDGRSIELREGKFFVTGNSLKPSDLVIDDPSVSTPHALITVNANVGLQMQDLMSERGVFVRPAEADSYQRHDEIVRVRHGDWIRFGDVEYLVCLIAHVGVK